MDTGRLRTGELIAGISGAVLILVMFLDWWGTGNGFIDVGFNAWQLADFLDTVWFLTGAVAVALAIATAMAQSVALPVAASAITAGLGILSTLLIAYRLLDPPFDASRKFWAFVGLVAAAGIAYGGWRSMQEEGTSFSGEADRLGGRARSGPPPNA